MNGSLEREPQFAMSVAPPDAARYAADGVLLQRSAHEFVNKSRAFPRRYRRGNRVWEAALETGCNVKPYILADTSYGRYVPYAPEGGPPRFIAEKMFGRFSESIHCIFRVINNELVEF